MFSGGTTLHSLFVFLLTYFSCCGCNNLSAGECASNRFWLKSDSGTSGQCVLDATSHEIIEASMSSGAGPERAFGAEKGTTHEGFRCASTSSESAASPWWSVSFADSVSVLAVNVSLASDEAVPEGGLELRIGNESDHKNNPLCTWKDRKTVEAEMEEAGSVLLPCEAVGKKVSLLSWTKSGTALVLCDVKVLVKDDGRVLDVGKCGDSKNISLVRKEQSLKTLRGMCVYKDLQARVNFTMALSTCRSLGLEMLNNENGDFYTEILRLLARELPEKRLFLWIGATKDSDEKWLWQDQSVVTDFLWGPDEPSGEDCAALDSALRLKWNSVRCVIAAGVVCVGTPVATCGRPEPGQNTIFKDEPRAVYSSGATVTYECATSALRLTGPSSRSCSATGRWSGQTPQCEAASTAATAIASALAAGSTAILGHLYH